MTTDNLTIAMNPNALVQHFGKPAAMLTREDISAYRKDVTIGLYGGDVSRKKKVLAKQAKGKKRMKRFGKVDIPSEAFTVMLKRD